VSIGVAYWTRSAVSGMIVGMMFVLVLSWLC
jgi:branched-subunit amino acid transport protein